ncbi:MAG: hypothetical protein IPM45_13420 [Acidimicrobiales bacterium]|nr:hypothetical protein [Acidimicrobiales bacterium]
MLDFEPQPGRADSGQLDTDIGGLLTELGETARVAGTGVLITLDELQYLRRDELSALIVGLHRISQLGLPVLVAGAGLPSLPGLAARQALVQPVLEEGAGWANQAVERVIVDTQGYPYFLQEFGKQAWNVAEGPEIGTADVEAAVILAADDLDRGFFRARIDKTTDAEREYLRAMAALGGPGPYKSGDVSRRMGKKTTQTGPVRPPGTRGSVGWRPQHP